jgi:type IV pilus assembly protein PilM
MIFGKKIEVGLDIGAYSLHWAAYDLRSRKSEVWCKPLFLHGFGDRFAPAFRDKMASIMQECQASSELWNSQVVVGVQGSRVVSGYLEFPALRESEMEMAVLSSVSREIPFPVHTMDIVHLPVDPLNRGKTAVFYSAWPKEQSRQLGELCSASTLKVKRLEVTGIGWTRELFRNRALDPKEFYCLINIGHETTHLLFAKGGYPYYLRDIPVGGKDMTEAISLRDQSSWIDAQELKENSPLVELLPSLGSIMSELRYEFTRTLEYFQRHFQREVRSVYLSGGGALMQDLPGWLESELELPVEVDGWDNLSPKELAPHPPLHKSALGLALGR